MSESWEQHELGLEPMTEQADDRLKAAWSDAARLRLNLSGLPGRISRLVLLAREFHPKPLLPVRRVIRIQRRQRRQHLGERTESIGARIRIAECAQLDRLDAPDAQPPHARRERAPAGLHARRRPPAERRTLRPGADRFPEALLEQELSHA